MSVINLAPPVMEILAFPIQYIRMSNLMHNLYSVTVFCPPFFIWSYVLGGFWVGDLGEGYSILGRVGCFVSEFFCRNPILIYIIEIWSSQLGITNSVYTESTIPPVTLCLGALNTNYYMFPHSSRSNRLLSYMTCEHQEWDSDDL